MLELLKTLKMLFKERLFARLFPIVLWCIKEDDRAETRFLTLARDFAADRYKQLQEEMRLKNEKTGN